MSVFTLPAVQQLPNKLVSNLYSQKQAGKYCDIQLKFGGFVLSAHACVVGTFSKFVDKLVSTGEVVLTMWTKVPVISIPLDSDDFSCLSCASKVLDFMYLGKIQIDDHHLDHIKVISHGLHIIELVKICEKHLEKCAGISKRIARPSKSSSSDVKLTEILSSKISGSKPTDHSHTAFEGPDFLGLTINEQQTTLAAQVPISLDREDMLGEEEEWAGLKCPVCNVTFMSLVKFQQHSSTHLGKIYTTCFVCSYASLRVSDLIKHLHEKEHGERVCSLCLFEASSNLSLKEHLQQHDHPQPFFCLTCNTRFQTRTALNSHIVKHSSETPHHCKECGRGFKWKHGLQSHMVTHTSVKKLLCDECGFSTAHLKSFIDHKSVHSGETFKCPVTDCKFKSVRKESVKQHLSTHTKEKPYQCEVCGQAFSQAKNLRRHAAIHDPGIDPEQCPFCPFQTNRSDKFRDHFRRNHRDGDKDKILSKSKNESHQNDQKKKEPRKKTRKSTTHKETALASRSNISCVTELKQSFSCKNINIIKSDNITLNELQSSCPDRDPGVVMKNTINYPNNYFNTHNSNCASLARKTRSPNLASPIALNGISEWAIDADQLSRFGRGMMGDNQYDCTQHKALLTSKEILNFPNLDTACQKLLLCNDSGSQIPCTLLLCEDKSLVRSSSSSVINTEVTNVSASESTEGIRPPCSSHKNGSLSLICHENINILENNEQDHPVFPDCENFIKLAAENNGITAHEEFSSSMIEDEVLVFSSDASKKPESNCFLISVDDNIILKNYLQPQDCLNNVTKEITNGDTTSLSLEDPAPEQN